MTLFEDTTANYIGHSSHEIEIIKPHDFPKMKQQTTTTTTNPEQPSSLVSINVPQSIAVMTSSSSPDDQVTQTTKSCTISTSDNNNNNNNNNPSDGHSHTYIRFDDSINHLPKDVTFSEKSFTITTGTNVDSNYEHNIKRNLVTYGKSASSTNNEYQPSSTSTSTLSSSPNSLTNGENKQGQQSNGDGDLMTRILAKFRSFPCAGIILAMLSGIFFATAGFIVKLVPAVNPIEIVIIR